MPGDYRNNSAHRQTIELLDDLLHNHGETKLSISDIAVIRSILQNLTLGSWRELEGSLIILVERRVERSRIFRMVTLNQDGLSLQSGQFEPDYDPIDETIYSDLNPLSCDDRLLYEFYLEFMELLNYDDGTLIIRDIQPDEVQDNKIEEEEQDDEFYIQKAARDYTYKEILALIKTMITGFQSIGFTGRDMVGLSRLLMLLENPDNFKVEGYLSLTVKQDSNGDIYLNEIRYDIDGLALSKGFYIIDEFGGDTNSEKVFPFADSYEALNAIDLIDNFVSSINDKIANSNLEFELTDSVDKIVELDVSDES